MIRTECESRIQWPGEDLQAWGIGDGADELVVKDFRLGGSEASEIEAGFIFLPSLLRTQPSFPSFFHAGSGFNIRTILKTRSAVIPVRE